jgi:catechol 2,3-dioxygenase-like lactoylglutathione lyase family enzyme
MLKDARAQASLPAKDLDRAKAFYKDKLGLEPYQNDGDNMLYRAGDGTGFSVYRTGGTASGTHTQIGFFVDNVVAEVKDLKSRGVKFEEYDFPGLKTVDGIAETSDAKAAWFKDSEGNIIGLVQLVRVPTGTSA